MLKSEIVTHRVNLPFKTKLLEPLNYTIIIDAWIRAYGI